MKITIAYVFEKATANYNVYRELDKQGKPMPDGLPKEQYAINCRPTQYLPKSPEVELLGKMIVITIEKVNALEDSKDH